VRHRSTIANRSGLIVTPATDGSIRKTRAPPADARAQFDARCAGRTAVGKIGPFVWRRGIDFSIAYAAENGPDI
jgi:hypothetical protein